MFDDGLALLAGISPYANLGQFRVEPIRYADADARLLECHTPSNTDATCDGSGVSVLRQRIACHVSLDQP